MTTTTMTTCRECKGSGEVGEYPSSRWNAEARAYELTTECPWCSGKGEVEVLYDVRSHGHNGDFQFCELEDVVTTLDAARKVARAAFERAETVQWVEVFGPDFEESLAIYRDGSEEGC